MTVTLRIPPWPTDFLEDVTALSAARDVHVGSTGQSVQALQVRIARGPRIVAVDEPDEYALVHVMRGHRTREQENR